MSYWAGYSGQGLALSGQEFEGFLEKYKEKALKAGNREILERIAEYEDGEEDISEIEFISDTGKEFCVYCADDGCCEGFRLWPFRVDGKPNTEYDTSSSFGSSNVFVIDADRQLDGVEVFGNPPYASYEEFVSEFVEKLGAYLPENFDWNAHIGLYSYACYA